MRAVVPLKSSNSHRTDSINTSSLYLPPNKGKLGNKPKDTSLSFLHFPEFLFQNQSTNPQCSEIWFQTMARLLHNLPMENFASFPPTMTIFFVVIAVFAVSSVTSFLCALHKHKHARSQRYRDDFDIGQKHGRLNSNLGGISSKALLMAKMISWRKAGDGEDEEAVWKKTIIMGERCRPLEFSGRIDYDSEGNQLPQAPLGSPHQGDCTALMTR